MFRALLEASWRAVCRHHGTDTALRGRQNLKTLAAKQKLMSGKYDRVIIHVRPGGDALTMSARSPLDLRSNVRPRSLTVDVAPGADGEMTMNLSIRKNIHSIIRTARRMAVAIHGFFSLPHDQSTAGLQAAIPIA